MKENRHAVKRSFLVEKQKDFSSKNVRIDSQPLKCLSGDGWCRTNYKITELHADKVKINFFLLLLVALLVLQVRLGVKNSVNFVGTLSFRSGKESFGFKKLLQHVWTLVYVFRRSKK